MTPPSGEGPESPSSLRTRSREELADYLLDIGGTLAAYGCPSYRLEEVIRLVGEAEGFYAEAFVLPTGLFLRVTAKDRDIHTPEAHRMIRVSDWGVDLERLTLVDEIFNDVIARRATIEQARSRIRAVIRKRPAWSPYAVAVATMAASGAGAVFFRGAPIDVAVAAVIGAVIAGSRSVLGRHPAQRLLNEFFGGLFAATCAWIASQLWPAASPPIIVTAGAISLFPGMTFTTGLAEVAQKNIVSGGARLVEAGVTLLLILFGVALLAGFEKMAGITPPSLRPMGASTAQGLSLPWQALAMVVASLSFGVIFQVPRRFLWAALLSGATGYAVTALATRYLPAHVAAFGAALAVCVLANALARATDRPAQLYQLPGLMLLVPGSFGFLALGALLQDNVEFGAMTGVSQGFAMALIGAALVIGVLVANVVMPARKIL